MPVGAHLVLSSYSCCEPTILRSTPLVPRQEGDAHPCVPEISIAPGRVESLGSRVLVGKIG